MQNNVARLFLDLQIATDLTPIPTKTTIKRWMKSALTACHHKDTEVTVRFVDLEEMTALNHQFRHKAYATNVLSFPFDSMSNVNNTPFIGDLVICLSVVQREACEQKKTNYHHLAHMIIHGLLHLLDYDHISAKEATIMESLEIEILKQLNIQNPYKERL